MMSVSTEKKPVDDRVTITLTGDIVYSRELKRMIFISDSNQIVVLHATKEQMNEIVHGESVPVTVEIRY